jgi:dTDP-4-amino-4,6-dideoxygalactose transaminase
MIEQLIKEKTKAIMWVNYGGIAPDRQALSILAKKYSI